MAETDKRELILARLAEIFTGIEGIRKATRNSLDVPEKDRPAIVMLDADESVDEETPDGRGRPTARANLLPIIVTMTPEIFIIDAAKPADIGTNLNALRIKVIKAVLSDETLLSLCRDGAIKFLGFATGLAAGRSLAGEAGISFSFSYVINPSKL